MHIYYTGNLFCIYIFIHIYGEILTIELEYYAAIHSYFVIINIIYCIYMIYLELFLSITGFTPILSETYKSITEESAENLEIVFVSSDQDTKSFEHYFGEMPWTAVPFGDSHIDSLCQKFSIRGIPAFFVLNGESGATVDENGRSTVANAKGDTAKCLNAWAK